jgi:transposase
MPKIITISLSESESEKLNNIFKYGSDWRERERARTILLLSEGLSVSEVASQLSLCERTVSNTRRKWGLSQFNSLSDAPRPGAPRKLSVDYQNLIVKHSEEAPLSARKIQEAIVQVGAPQVHINTIRAVLRRANKTWKRTRHSLKKNETK